MAVAGLALRQSEKRARNASAAKIRIRTGSHASGNHGITKAWPSRDATRSARTIHYIELSMYATAPVWPDACL
ncbi:hypothetical protein M3665_25280, partial [Bacillus licheniformis]|nr:hypothetical protein [Bacillus licheniformis]